MRSSEDALKLIVWLSSEIATLDKKRKEWPDLNAADRAEKLRMLDFQFEQYERERMDVLEDLVQFPPQHLQYREKLEQANKEMGPYRMRVFIMTKYPDGADAKLDAQLKTVINTVKDAVKAKHYHPYLASDKAWHHNVWENVEFYMLACARGIAIVEDRFNPKLNPNVAMEWGWMRAMKKDILYLVEKGAKETPADIMGLIKGRFDWDNPEADIPRLIAENLPFLDL